VFAIGEWQRTIPGRRPLVDGERGALHMGVAVCSLPEGDALEPHLHAAEESFFVLDGKPTLRVGGEAFHLSAGEGGLLPVGVAHGWEAPSGPARWIEVQVPRPPEDAGGFPDTFAAELGDAGPAEAIDPGDPRNRHFFRFDPDSRGRSPTGGTLVFGGASIRMLVDERLDAALHTLFMVEFQPGAEIRPHDHPFEEAFCVLEGEVQAEAGGELFTMGAGDFLWTGVGCRHAFRNAGDAPVRWLEAQAPQPPARHAFRFADDWETLAR
jgi:quercetin dioxygenase-like cupin family protein